MLEILYCIFIFPIEQILKWTLFALVKITQSYGLSIILLSILVQLFMLKITLYFDNKASAVEFLKTQCDEKIKEFKRVFKGAELQSYIHTLYKQKHFHPSFTLFGLSSLMLQIPLFIAVIYLIENADYLQNVSFLWMDNLRKPDSIIVYGFNIHILPLLMTTFALVNVFCNSRKNGQRIQGILIAILFLILLYEMPSALVLYWTCNMGFILLKTILKKCQDKKCTDPKYSTYKKLPIIDPIKRNSTIQSKQSKFSKLLLHIFTPYTMLDLDTYKTYRDISILAILNICLLAFVFSPYVVYNSDIFQFDTNQVYQTLSTLFGIFLISSFFIVYFTSFFYKTKLLKLGAYSMSVILGVAIIYTFVLTGDYTGKTYGKLENFVFQGGVPIYNIWNKWVDIACVLLVATGNCILFYVTYSKYFKRVLFLISSFLVCYISYLFIDITLSSKYLRDPIIEQRLVEPSYNETLLSFSKEKNILVLILDAFTGSHFDIILQHNPDLKNILDGFTYYDNTLATSNNTQFNTPAILGGHKYSTLSLIRYGILKDPNSKYLEAFTELPQKMQNRGWNIAMYGTDPVNPKILQTILGSKALVANPKNESYKNLYINHYGLQTRFEEIFSKYRANYNSVSMLLSLGLFRTSPYSFRSRIYVDDKWLFAKDNPSADLSVQLEYVSDIAVFPYYSKATSETKTFKYIKSLSTHFPWYLNADCIPDLEATSELPEPYNKIIPQEYRTGYNNNHYNNEVCAIKWLKDWILWFKNEGLYDNTAIIIASDHGHYDSFKQIENNNGNQLGLQSDALLLVKPFGNKKPFTVDHRLMSNADIHSLICSFANISCEDKNPLLVPNNERILYHSNSPFETFLTINKAFLVRKEIYNPKNWEDITEKIRNGAFKPHEITY